MWKSLPAIAVSILFFGNGYALDNPSSVKTKDISGRRPPAGPSVTESGTNFGPRDLLLRNSDDFSDRSGISKEQVLEDLAILKYALNNAYIGRSFLPKGAFAGLIAKIDALVDNAGPSSSTILCNQLAKIAWEVPDYHFSVYHYSARCNSYSLKPQYGSVGGNVATQREIPWEISHANAGEQEVPIVAITSFLSSEDKKWAGLWPELQKIKDTAPAVIFDLRGNGGGDDRTAAKIAQQFYGQKFPDPVGFFAFNKDPAAYAISANSYKIKEKRLLLDGQPVPDYVAERCRQAIADLETSKPGSGVGGNFPPPPPIDPILLWKKPIYLLTDKSCVSACESMVQFFESHPYDRRVGDNTAGMMTFGDSGSVILPNSQTEVNMGRKYWKRRDGRFLEKIGIEPTIRVPANSDALQYALKDILKSK